MTKQEYPTWEDTISDLFQSPYWIDESKRQSVVSRWNGCMTGYGIQLDQYASVREWSVTIYDHLYSRDMPRTHDESELWPDDALELLRAWVNQGCRQQASDPIDAAERIPPPRPRPVPLRVRKNILDLSDQELAVYRMKLEDLGIADASPDSPWQKLAYVHTNWCLHYQEAFLLWHRAYLLYLEELIDIAIPYWDFMSPNVNKDGSPEAGIPQAFKDKTYVHPLTGEVRPNPLRFAAAKDGCSKACQGKTGEQTGDIDCRWVQRDPILYTSGDECREARQNKLDLLIKFQEQVLSALKFQAFSTPQGQPPTPWANIQSFDPPPPDSDYPYRNVNFDGAYEQPHDNFHGWLGPDMADNAYTAFDPVFWSYHSNIDRIFELWLRDNPKALYTAAFHIRPFVGSRATDIDLTDRRDYLFTTIGDLAKDSRSLGVDYAPSRTELKMPVHNDDQEQRLYVVFDGVRCTFDSYAIDVFLNHDDPAPEHIDAHDPHYVGRFMRVGMGIEDNTGRCIKQGVRRVLDATTSARSLGLEPSSECRISLLVTDVARNRVVPFEEYQRLPGFLGRLAWSRGLQPKRQERHCPACH